MRQTMKHRDDINEGDPVEVRVVERPPAHPITPRSGMQEAPECFVRERWIPATVCHATPHEIGVSFSDGERKGFTRYSRDWRPA